MTGRVINLDGCDIGSPVEGKPYREPTPEQIEKRRLSLISERERRAKTVKEQ